MSDNKNKNKGKARASSPPPVTKKPRNEPASDSNAAVASSYFQRRTNADSALRKSATTLVIDQEMGTDDPLSSSPSSSRTRTRAKPIGMFSAEGTSFARRDESAPKLHELRFEHIVTVKGHSSMTLAIAYRRPCAIGASRVKIKMPETLFGMPLSEAKRRRRQSKSDFRTSGLHSTPVWLRNMQQFL
ncbi:hypothetical protein A4X09_0g5305 [Tilletia walkeri]|uniref:Uncharacterized protein n=1 Tax=Tilletia walkeri TaxID=117179 RepID=A0A8X7T359_9BASI|nr:hypothetical protein A4X09_0g5305 [Tilletia walkeri]